MIRLRTVEVIYHHSGMSYMYMYNTCYMLMNIGSGPGGMFMDPLRHGGVRGPSLGPRPPGYDYTIVMTTDVYTCIIGSTHLVLDTIQCHPLVLLYLPIDEEVVQVVEEEEECLGK